MTNDERIKLACSELTNLTSALLKQSMESMIEMVMKSQENDTEKAPEKNNPENATEENNQVWQEGYYLDDYDFDDYNESYESLTSYDDEDEEQLVRQAVNRCRGNVSAAAKMLNISRPTLYAKMKKYGL